MFGGGRYDDLVELYSGKSVPASGFAPGNVTTALFLDNWDLWPQEVSSTDVLVTVFSEELHTKSWEIANDLRLAGFNVEQYLYSGEKMATQLEYANKKTIPYVVIVGPEESENGTFVWKDMVEGEQRTTTVDGLLATMEGEGHE